MVSERIGRAGHLPGRARLALRFPKLSAPFGVTGWFRSGGCTQVVHVDPGWRQ